MEDNEIIMGGKMIKKSIHILKNNSSLILLFVAYQVIAFSIMFLLYPSNFNEFMNTSTNAFNFIAYFTAMAKMLIAALLVGILGILFLSGYGNMLSEAVITGKTVMKSFLTGIQKYFVRTLLSALLMYAISMVVSILVGFIMFAVIFSVIFSGSTNITGLSIVIILIITVIMTLPLPFILLWYPSIFIDNTGVIKGLKNGAKAGVKNYWKLLLLLFIMMAPIAGNMIFNMNEMTNGDIFTPATIVMYLIIAIISIVLFPILFLIYHDYKKSTMISGININI